MPDYSIAFLEKNSFKNGRDHSEQSLLTYTGAGFLFHQNHNSTFCLILVLEKFIGGLGYPTVPKTGTKATDPQKQSISKKKNIFGA